MGYLRTGLGVGSLGLTELFGMGKGIDEFQDDISGKEVRDKIRDDIRSSAVLEGQARSAGVDQENLLRAVMTGRSTLPSAALDTARQTGEMAMRQQAAMAMGGRPGSGAAGARQAATAGAQLMAQGNQQAQILSTKEQQAYRQMATQQLGNMLMQRRKLAQDKLMAARGAYYKTPTEGQVMMNQLTGLATAFGKME